MSSECNPIIPFNDDDVKDDDDSSTTDTFRDEEAGAAVRRKSTKNTECRVFGWFLLVSLAIAVPLGVMLGRPPEQSTTAEPAWSHPVGGAGGAIRLSNSTHHSGGGSGMVALSADGQRLLVCDYPPSSQKPIMAVLDLTETVNHYGKVISKYVRQDNTGLPSAPPYDGEESLYIPQYLTSMSLDGKTIAIGNPHAELMIGDNTELRAKGNVQVYRAFDEQNEWNMVGNAPSFYDYLVNAPSNLQIESGNFGVSTSLSGDGSRLAVGVTNVQGSLDHNEGNDSASSSTNVYSFVQVLEFSLAGNTWNLLGNMLEGTCQNYNATTTNSTGCIPCAGKNHGGEHDFGVAVAMNAPGTRLIVGAPQADHCLSQTSNGFARVYDWNATTQRWSPLGRDIVVPELVDNPAFVPRNLGSSVSISADGSRVAVGSNAGAVVLEFDSSTQDWVVMGDNHFFKWSHKNHWQNEGTTVSLSRDGNRVAMGGPKAESHHGGKADVWEWNGASWSQVGKSIRANPGAGSSISLASTNASIVALYADYEVWVYQE